MRKLLRSEWEKMAAVDDMFNDMFNDWDLRCRERSTTGENMERENMDAEEFAAFKQDMHSRALKLVSVGWNKRNQAFLGLKSG